MTQGVGQIVSTFLKKPIWDSIIITHLERKSVEKKKPVMEDAYNFAGWQKLST